MASPVSDYRKVDDCRSCLSAGSTNKKPKGSSKCNSVPLLKPNLSLKEKVTFKFKELADVMKKVLKQDFQSSYSKSVKETSTLNDCELLIRDMATQLDRVFQYKSCVLIGDVREDRYSEKECQQFVLEWAAEVNDMPQKHLGQAAAMKSSSRDPGGKGSPEQQKEDEDTSSQAQEQRLKEAQNILHQWAWNLKSERRKASVCLGEETCAVLQDLERQWKRGELSNTLPIMEFLMWTVIQEQPEEGSAPKCWMKTRQRFSTSASVKHIPDLVWNWIHEAHAEITLDPKTANSNLILSKDRKGVKMDIIIDEHRVFYTGPHNYDMWWCVLGTEGFTTGRHYWEVGVKGKRDWRIGVVKESAPRKGFVSLNTQCGYWTLRLQLGMLMALTVPVTKLPEVEIPSKVGVYLDIEEGQVSFYDAERRCHIYTFCDTFTEKLYPVFGTTETDKYLVIV